MTAWTMQTVGKITYIGLTAWEPWGVKAAISSRCEGDSPMPYSSLNLALHVGDKEETVLFNRSRFIQELGGAITQMVCCQQIHGARVYVVSKDDIGRGAMEQASAIPDCDALLSNIPGLFLAEFFADCFPLFFFDPIRKVIGIAHAGWKGTIGKIAVQTVNRMKECFSSQFEDIKVFIGPGIGPCCFEIQPDLAERVSREFPDYLQLLRHESGCITWDLALTNAVLLTGIGIKPENIETCGLCTSCLPELFYSYRRDGGTTGRMGGIISLR